MHPTKQISSKRKTPNETESEPAQLVVSNGQSIRRGRGAYCAHRKSRAIANPANHLAERHGGKKRAAIVEGRHETDEGWIAT